MKKDLVPVPGNVIVVAANQNVFLSPRLSYDYGGNIAFYTHAGPDSSRTGLVVGTGYNEINGMCCFWSFVLFPALGSSPRLGWVLDVSVQKTYRW